MHLPPPIRRTSGTVASTRSRAREDGPYRQSAAASASPCTACVCVCVRARTRHGAAVSDRAAGRQISLARHVPTAADHSARETRPQATRRATVCIGAPTTTGELEACGTIRHDGQQQQHIALAPHHQAASCESNRRATRPAAQRQRSAAQALARTLTVPLRRVEQVLAYGVVLDAEPQMRASLQRLRRRRRRLLQRVH